MSQFLGNIVSKHLGNVENVLPRLPGKFESADFFSENETPNIPVQSRPSAPLSVDESVPVFDRKIQTRVSTDTPGNQALPVTSTGNLPFQAAPEKPTLIQIGEGHLTKPDISWERGVLPSDALPLEQPKKNKPFFQPPVVEKLENYEPKDEMPERVTGSQTQTFSALPLPNSEIEPALKPRNAPEKYTQTIPLPMNPLKNDRDILGALGEPRGLEYISGVQRAEPISRPETPPAPVIKVTIGQIHVRAVTPPPPVAANRPKQVNKPMLTLEDYLKGRG